MTSRPTDQHTVLQDITLQVLVDAAYKCARGVRWKASVSAWMFNVVSNCAKLLDSLRTGKYKLSRYNTFNIYDKKPRTIHSTRFPDRVVQRALCDVYLYDAVTKPLVHENCACLDGKGMSFALDLVKSHLRNYYFSGGRRSNTGWYVKADVKRFFDSTPHKSVVAAVNKHVKDPWAKERVVEIIESFKDPRPFSDVIADQFGARGIILGSQISQLLQLLVLNPIDHAMKQKFKVRHYVRYMDDFLIVVETKEEAAKLLDEMQAMLNAMGFRLNEKSRIGKLEDGFTFLNNRFLLTRTGKVKMKLSKKTVGREMRRMSCMSKKLKSGKMQASDFMQHVNSWFGSNMSRMTRSQIYKARKRCIELIGRQQRVI